MAPIILDVSLLLLLLFLSVFGPSHGCLQDPASAYRFTGAACRLTHPAAVVLNEKTTKVIEAAFQRARYPSVKNEKSLLFIGKVKYGLDNLEIHNLTIGRSGFELRAGEGIAMEISNVSAVFRGTIQYGYGSWLVNVAQSIDFEIESQIDLGINPKLYCGKGKVAADTSDCYLNFHKLRLHLQGDREPNWLKKLFTDFITFTVKLVIKGQICKEINKVANILADFIQSTAENFLSDGDISMDIGVTAAPVITSYYIESYHKGLTNYKNTSAVISDSVFHPSQLTENRMVYFWLSGQQFALCSTSLKYSIILCLCVQCLLESDSPELRVWTSSVPFLNTSTVGATVRAQASGQLLCGNQSTPTLFFQTVFLPSTGHLQPSDMRSTASLTLVTRLISLQQRQTTVEPPTSTCCIQVHFNSCCVKKKPKNKCVCNVVFPVLELELTRLLDKQGTNLFDIVDPEVLPRDGFVVIQMDFGFPRHLLVEFLRKTLQ
uniref:Cholesteryl ester transfer protein n=1 Tax=Scophthalmus maximus TaxID=52904 RepID=A0A8D3DX50_SCOMX